MAIKLVIFKHPPRDKLKNASIAMTNFGIALKMVNLMRTILEDMKG